MFDIDSTLFSASTGIEEKFDAVIEDYAFSKTNLTREEFEMLKNDALKSGDIAIWRLQEQLKLDKTFYDEALAQENFTEIFKPDEKLRQFLKSLRDQNKKEDEFEYSGQENDQDSSSESFDSSKVRFRLICFTNNSVYGAKMTLQALNLTDCFEAVVALDTSVYTPGFHKPKRRSHEFIEHLWEIDSENKNIIFFDDREKNIMAAVESGWKGIHIRAEDDLKHVVQELILDL